MAKFGAETAIMLGCSLAQFRESIMVEEDRVFDTVLGLGFVVIHGRDPYRRMPVLFAMVFFAKLIPAPSLTRRSSSAFQEKNIYKLL
jgi:hypothetical protein